MRKFASDTAMKLISRMGWEKGEALEHKMLTGAIEKAQMRVEENNFGGNLGETVAHAADA